MPGKAAVLKNLEMDTFKWGLIEVFEQTLYEDVRSPQKVKVKLLSVLEGQEPNK